MRRLSRRRAARHDAGSYLIDGPTLLGEALRSGVRLESVYVESDFLGQAVLDDVPDEVAVREVRPGTLAKVLDVVTPNGMVSVARIESRSPRDVIATAQERKLPLVVLVDVADPGNVGTLMRAAEAAGCSGIIVTAQSADPYSPKVVRASAGSIFRVPIATSTDGLSVTELLHHGGIMTLATVAQGGGVPEALDLGSCFALMMGNEAHGLSTSMIDSCAAKVSIPMEGATESLNVSIAAAVVLFEAARQRRIGDPPQAV